jgi:hypothetical protein
MQKDMHVILTVFDQASFAVSEKLFPGIRSVIDDAYARDHYHGRENRRSAAEKTLSFTEQLEKYMKERNLKTSQVYRGANLSKQTFSKIILHPESRPARNTVMALCIGLQLKEREARDLLASAGYAFIPDDRFDSFIRYFLNHQKYNIVEDNIVLNENGLPMLGSRMHI